MNNSWVSTRFALIAVGLASAGVVGAAFALYALVDGIETTREANESLKEEVAGLKESHKTLKTEKKQEVEAAQKSLKGMKDAAVRLFLLQAPDSIVGLCTNSRSECIQAALGTCSSTHPVPDGGKRSKEEENDYETCTKKELEPCNSEVALTSEALVLARQEAVLSVLGISIDPKKAVDEELLEKLGGVGALKERRMKIAELRARCEKQPSSPADPPTEDAPADGRETPKDEK